MKAKLVTAFYSFGLIHHLFTCYYSNQVDFSKTTKQGVLDIQLFANRYLTSWNMGLQTIYFILALICEIMLFNKQKISSETIRRFAKLRGYMFTTFILPCTAVVAIFFWLFYHMDPEFVMPDGIEEVFPEWVNHSIHTNIIFLPIIELTLQNMYVPSIWMSLIGLTIYSHIYNTMYIFTYFETGKWMYPLYYHLSWPQRIALMEMMFLMGALVCVLGLFIQKLKSEKCDVSKTSFKKRVISVAKKIL